MIEQMQVIQTERHDNRSIVAIINSSRLFVLGNHFNLQGNPFFS
jgi:hypothetical protein